MVYHVNRYLFKLRIYAHFIGSEDIVWTEINRGNRVFDIVALIELVDRSEKCEIRTYIHAYDYKTGILCDTADYINAYSSDGMNIDNIIDFDDNEAIMNFIISEFNESTNKSCFTNVHFKNLDKIMLPSIHIEI